MATPATHNPPTPRALLLAEIARTHLSVPTLAERGADSLDLHTVSVWALEAALRAAYNAGRASATPAT